MFDSPVEEIKSRLDIADVLSEYIRLIPAGPNFKALCPFHREKTPSFMVSRDKQIWHCFGACGEGGDIFTFLMKMEGLEFPEALKILAQKAGVQLKKQDPTLANKRTRLMDLVSLAANFYHQSLLKSEQAQAAREYFKRRGLQNETIESFKLGYAPDFSDALNQFLIKKGFKADEIIAAGLAFQRDDGRSVDRFRERLMFPLADAHGHFVGFSGRLLKERTDVGKYINTPQSLIYDKSRVLYGLVQAKEAIKQAELAIVVEGQMDLLASHQAGVKNTVAASGTALTLEQVKLLKRYTSNLALAFDMDAAGENAAERGIAVALGSGLEVKIIVLDNFKDPDECIKKDPSRWLAAIKNAKPQMDNNFDKTLAGLDLTKPEQKSRAADILLKVISQLPDKIKQDHHLRRLAQALEVNEIILRERLAGWAKKSEVRPVETAPLARPSRELLLAERLLALLLKFPEQFRYLVNSFKIEVVPAGRPRELYKNFIIYYTGNTGQALEQETVFDYQGFKSFLSAQDEALMNYADVLGLLADKEYPDLAEDFVQKEFLKLNRFLKDSYIAKERERLARLMRQAEEQGQREKVEELAKEFNQLLNGF